VIGPLKHAMRHTKGFEPPFIQNIIM
jgi:hypothetical protein